MSLLFFCTLGWLAQLQAAFPYTPVSHCDQLLEKTYYTICYSKDHRQAFWTYHPLFLESIDGKQKRTDNFREDTRLSFPPVMPNDLRPTHLDRGHLVPAADMKLNYNSMSETFLMSNISPQVAAFNRGIWSQLEATLRRLVKDFGDGYVVTGAILTSKSPKAIKGISLPDSFYKILYIPAKKTMYAFVIENKKITGKSIWDYVTTVDAVEKITGVDFFSELNPKKQSELESRPAQRPTSY